MSVVPRICLGILIVVCVASWQGNHSALATEPGIAGRIGGGNITLNRHDAESKFKTLQSLGAGMCRIPVGKDEYWRGRSGTPAPERLDEVVLLAHRYGITPILLFEYYTRWHGTLGGRNKWQVIGKAFAERFRPNSPWLQTQGIHDWGISFYSAINEPTWKDNNPTPIPPDAYAEALEGLADGVHEVDASLHVSPGGWIEGSLFSNKSPYVKAVAPLFNNGKLYAIGIHRYWDVAWVPMDGKYRFSLQSQFDEVKRNAGIEADVKFYTDEFNFKKRKVTEEEAAKGFLTAIWDALGVVGKDGQVVSQFAFPWNIFHLTTKDTNYGLCEQQDPWMPTARGKTLQLVCRLSAGMRFVSADPKAAGLFVLEGNGKKLWVWQNREKWTDRLGTSITIDGIPAGTQKLEVYGWDGLRKEVAVGQSDRLLVEQLIPGETYMFLARQD